jgi:hypothetical protein
MIHIYNKHFFDDTICDPYLRLKDKVIVTLEDEDFIQDITDFSISIDNNDNEIINSVQPVIRDTYQIDIGKTHFVHKSKNYGSIFILPKVHPG